MLLKPSSNSTILQSISISVVKSEPLSLNQWVLENKNHAPPFTDLDIVYYSLESCNKKISFK